MKKIIQILLIVLLFISCNKNHKKIELSDVSISINDTLKPQKNKFAGYSAIKFKIKGFVNDTVDVGFKSFYDNKSHEKINYRLKGKIDTVYMADYYGDGIEIFYYKPNNTTKGNLEIEYGIY
jgi:hypothetical protein